MNKYGQLAMSHWQKTDPERYAAIPDKPTFFSSLGQEAETAIQELALALAGPDPPSEGYLAKVGRLNMARLRAEEKVLADLVLIPEPEDPQEEEPASDLLSDVRAAIQKADQEFYDQHG